MIVKLIGVIEDILEDRVNINVKNIVYEVIMPAVDLGNITKGVETLIYIKHIIREDGHFLYGFLSTDLKHWFNELTKISGLGPKFAISILSTLSITDLQNAIISKDEATLSRPSGVGKKLANRIITEMQPNISKLGIILSPANNLNIKSNNTCVDAINALIKLGFSKASVQNIVTQKFSEDSNLSVEDLIRHTLSKL